MTELPPTREPAANAGPADARPHRGPSTIAWPPILLVGVAVLAVGLDRWLPLPWPGVDDRAARIIGLGIGGVGLGLIAWAAWTLHRAKTTVLPHRAASHLVTCGPFVRFRNPIYLGDVMVLLGAAELTKNIWFVAGAIAFAVLVTVLAILPEERHLEARFGDDYRAYKSRSRRWI